MADNTRPLIVTRLLGFTPPIPEGMPTRPIRIIRGDHVEVRDVPHIVRQKPVDRPANALCCGLLHRRR